MSKKPRKTPDVFWHDNYKYYQKGDYFAKTKKILTR